MSLLTDGHVLSIEKRLGEENVLWAADHPRVAEAPVARCLKCGWPVDESKHYGSVWYFDRGTETIHACRESYGVQRRRREAALYRERFPND